MLDKPIRKLSPELQALDRAADEAWRRVFEEYRALKRKPQWVGQDNYNRYQGSHWDIRGWGK